MRKPAGIGTSAGIGKFSDTRKSQSDKWKSQSANGVVGLVSRTATAAMSVKVANTSAARNDGVEDEPCFNARDFAAPAYPPTSPVARIWSLQLRVTRRLPCEVDRGCGPLSGNLFPQASSTGLIIPELRTKVNQTAWRTSLCRLEGSLSTTTTDFRGTQALSSRANPHTLGGTGIGPLLPLAAKYHHLLLTHAVLNLSHRQAIRCTRHQRAQAWHFQRLVLMTRRSSS